MLTWNEFENKLTHDSGIKSRLYSCTKDGAILLSSSFKEVHKNLQSHTIIQYIIAWDGLYTSFKIIPTSACYQMIIEPYDIITKQTTQHQKVYRIYQEDQMEQWCSLIPLIKKIQEVQGGI